MSDQGRHSADVAVIGAGPVGLLLGVLLARDGWRVEVLERRVAPYRLPRAVHVDHEAARVLQKAGVMAEVMARAEPMDAYEWRSADGRVLLCVQGGPGSCGWPASIMFNQGDLQEALARALRTHPNVEVAWGQEMTAFAPGSTGCVVEARGADGSRRSIEAQWVVGCDGAHSRVRELMGVGEQDLGFSHPWVVADVVPADTRPWRPLNVQVCDPARPMTAVSGGRGRRRFEFLCLPGEVPEKMASPEVLWGLLERWRLSPRNAVLERQAAYRFVSRLALRWQGGPRDRALLAGDAAHQMPPFAGQGLCAGIRDVGNLAWKLSLVLAGAAPEAVMATYPAERVPLARGEIDISVALGQVICTLEAEAAAQRDDEMAAAAAVSGPVPIPPPPRLGGPGLGRRGDPQAGLLSPQGPVSYQGRQGLLDDVAGPGWQLLGARPLPSGLSATAPPSWAGRPGLSSCHLGPAGDFADLEGVYQRWWEEMGGPAAVLVRPDGRIFGTAGDSDDVAPLLDAARRSLATGAPAP